MIFFLEILCKSTLLFAVAWILSGSLRNRWPSASHLVWAVAFLAILGLPAVTPLLERHTILSIKESPPESGASAAPLSVLPGPNPRSVHPESQKIAEPALSGPQILLGFWALGALLFLSRGFAGLWSLRRIRRIGSQPFEVAAGVLSIPPNWDLRIATTSLPPTAMTWGILKPAILLPVEASEWPRERLEAVLLHEFAHVRRFDFASQLLAELACALYWFNPFVWLGARAMRSDAELAADDAVIRSGIMPSAYAAELLQIAAALGPQRPLLSRAGVSAMTSPKIESRLRSVLSPTARRRGVGSLHVLLATVLAGIAVTAIASLQVETQFSAGPRPASEKTEALIRARSLGLAVLMYSADYDDMMPYGQSTIGIKYVTRPYVKDVKSYESPSKGGQFLFNLHLGGILTSDVDTPAEIPMWFEHLAGGQDPAASYVDGHARMVTADRSAKFEAGLKRKFQRLKSSKPLPANYGDNSHN